MMWYIEDHSYVLTMKRIQKMYNNYELIILAMLLNFFHGYYDIRYTNASETQLIRSLYRIKFDALSIFREKQ